MQLEYAASTGLLTKITDWASPAARSVQFGYDPQGRFTSITDRAGATTRFSYQDARHRLLSVTDARGNTTVTNTYDLATDRVTEQRNAVGGITKFSYGTTAQTTTVTDARGNATRFVHNAEGQLTSIMDAQGQTIGYTYDARGNQTSFRDRNQNLWKFTYDSRGNRTEGVTRYERDELYRITKATDPFDQAVKYGYNANSLRQEMTYPDGKRVQFRHDALNRLTDVLLDGEGPQHYDFDRWEISRQQCLETARARPRSTMT